MPSDPHPRVIVVTPREPEQVLQITTSITEDDDLESISRPMEAISASPIQNSIFSTDTILTIEPPSVTMQQDLEEGMTQITPSTPTAENAGSSTPNVTRAPSPEVIGATNLSNRFRALFSGANRSPGPLTRGSRGSVRG